MLYRARHFVPFNKKVSDFLGIDPIIYPNHAIMAELKKIVKYALHHGVTKTDYIRNDMDQLLVVTVIPDSNLEHCLLVITWPDIADLMNQEFEFLQDFNDWDYLLYLHTTHSGGLITQALPGVGKQIFTLQIALLKLAMSKQPALLEVVSDDAEWLVRMLHHVSGRKDLEHIDLGDEHGVTALHLRLFGTSPFYHLQEYQAIEGMLKRLHQGSLWFSDAHLLNLDLQDGLASYMQYGYYQLAHSDIKMFSDVRLFLSTPVSINLQLGQSKFSRSLFQFLSPMFLEISSPVKLNEDELISLSEGYAQQLIPRALVKNIYSLPATLKQRILNNPPASFMELKNIIRQMLTQKAKSDPILTPALFDNAYALVDPELIEAARMGKKALKDPRTMSLLWYKFHGNQNKIAELLQVNRSSVSRRVREYGLG
jgi:transcriptional regulator of aromatic amino acid metabolism